MITTSVLVRFINRWDSKNTPYLQQFCFRTFNYYFRVNKLSAIFLKNTIKIIGIIGLPIFLILRDSWNDKFFGDPMDSRMSWVVYEHWYQFFLGNRELRNTLFFYPYDKSLGFSDSFLLNGVFHSIFRVIGIDPIDSWKYSNILAIFISIVGLAILSRKLFDDYIHQFGFVLLISTSYVYLNNLSGQPNVSFYFISTFFITAALNFTKKDPSKLSKILAFSGLTLIPPVMLLSVWYAGFYIYLITSILIAISIALNKKLFKNYIYNFLNNIKSISKLFIFLTLSLSVSLHLLFIYIYLPNAKMENKVWSDIERWQPTLMGNLQSIIQSLNISTKYFPTMVQADPIFVGIGFTSIIIILFLLFLLLFSQRFRDKYFVSFDFLLLVTSIVLFTLFLTVSNFSVFEYLWNFFDPLKSIRFTSRIYVFIFAIWVYLFLKSFAQLKINYLSKSKFRLLQLFIVIILVSLQISDPISKWAKEVYEPDEYLGVVTQIKENCTAFVVDSPGRGWWDDQLQGMTLMALTHVPTANGYSGAFPLGYELGDWSKDSQLVGIGKWLVSNETTDSICLVQTSGIKELSFPLTILTDENFDILESNLKGSSWNWSLSDQAKVKVLNFSKDLIRGQVVFEIRTADCEQRKVDFKITDLRGDLVLNQQIDSKISKIRIDVELPGEAEAIYNLSVNTPGCVVDGGARKIFFLLKDLTSSTESGSN